MEGVKWAVSGRRSIEAQREENVGRVLITARTGEQDGAAEQRERT